MKPNYAICEALTSLLEGINGVILEIYLPQQKLNDVIWLFCNP